jgi:hypothetical protein
MCAALGDLVEDFRQRQEKLEVENRTLATKRADDVAAAGRHDKA